MQRLFQFLAHQASIYAFHSRRLVSCRKLALLLLVAGLPAVVLPDLAQAHLFNEVPVITRWVRESTLVCVVKPVIGTSERIDPQVAQRLVMVEPLAGYGFAQGACPDQKFPVWAEAHHLTQAVPTLLFAGARAQPSHPQSSVPEVLFDHPAVAQWPTVDPVAFGAVAALVQAKTDAQRGSALQQLLRSKDETAIAAVFASLKGDPALAKIALPKTFCQSVVETFATRVPAMRTATALTFWVTSMVASVSNAQCLETMLTPIKGNCKVNMSQEEQFLCEGPTRTLVSAALRFLPPQHVMAWQGLCQSQELKQLCKTWSSSQ